MTRFKRIISPEFGQFSRESPYMKMFLYTILAIVLNIVSGELSRWEGSFVPSPDGSINLEIILTLGTARNDTIQNTISNVGTISLISGENDLITTENAGVGNVNDVLSHLLANMGTEQPNVEQTETKIGGEKDDENRLLLVEECIKAIESNQFDVAEEKLSEINNDTYISLVVKQVYNNQKDNFDTLMKFGETIQNVGRRFILYNDLYNELVDNDDQDPIKLLRLIRSLHGKVLLAIDGSESEGKMKEEIESLITTITKSFISLQSDKNIDPKAAVELAFETKELLNYESLNSDLKQQMETIKEKLPKSVKNMAFLPQVCISDIKRKGYIYADQSNENNVGNRKILIGDLERDVPCRKEWTFEHIYDNVIRIINRVVNETLYLSDEKFGNPDNLQLSKRLRKHGPNEGISEDEKWAIEPVGDNIRLKNIAKNSYSSSGYSTNGVWKMVDVFEIA